MKQTMAIPSVGGMVVSVFVTIFIAPCLFCAVEEWKWKRAQKGENGAVALAATHGPILGHRAHECCRKLGVLK